MNPDIKRVSTRSRPKAAGLRQRCESACLCGFNTQPPEGGWLIKRSTKFVSVCFNTQPPEGGWVVFAPDIADWFMFQHAAARRRLAAVISRAVTEYIVSTRSRPKAAGDSFIEQAKQSRVSTRSRPKAAGASRRIPAHCVYVSTRSRPKAAGDPTGSGSGAVFVSTRSRPKAAGR